MKSRRRKPGKMTLVVREASCQDGFTIVEISIILTIISLISAAILIANDLIHSAEIRATMKEFEKFNAAVGAFQLKFNCLPADCASAGELGFNPLSAGNGDHIIGACPRGNPEGIPSEPCSWMNNLYGSGAIDMEYYHFWYQLSEANFIRTHFDFYPGPAPHFGMILGINTPQGPLKPRRRADEDNPGGWSVQYNVLFTSELGGGEISGHSFMLASKTLIGGQTSDTQYPGGFGPIDLFILDQKFDDGKPLRGNVRAWQGFARVLDPALLVPPRPEFPAGKPVQYYLVNPSAIGPPGPRNDFCISTDGVAFDYNVQYDLANVMGLCSIAIKAAF